MKEKLREKLNTQLNDLAYSVQESMGSYFFWGEVELPKCLRKELEEKEEK